LLIAYIVVLAMHGHTIKFINAKQVKGMNSSTNIKRKPYKTNAAIWYNKTCRDKQLTLNYISIKNNGSNRHCANTLRAAKRFGLNQEFHLSGVTGRQQRRCIIPKL
jgi:hypothetical protein